MTRVVNMTEHDIQIKQEFKLNAALVGIILSIFVQAATVLWWGAQMDARVRQLEQDTAPLKAIPGDVRVLNTQMNAFAQGQMRIENKLDKMEEKD